MVFVPWDGPGAVTWFSRRRWSLSDKTVVPIAGGATQRVPNFEVRDPKLCAYDKVTGKLVAEVALPRNITGAPMTYMLNDKQFVVVPTGGANLPAELIALSLP